MQIKQLISISHANPEWTSYRVADTRVRIVSPLCLNNCDFQDKTGAKTLVFQNDIHNTFYIGHLVISFMKRIW